MEMFVEIGASSSWIIGETVLADGSDLRAPRILGNEVPVFALGRPFGVSCCISGEFESVSEHSNTQLR